MSENKADELSAEQKAMLRKCFDTFDREKSGSISADMVGTILNMMGLQCNSRELREIIEEIDVDGSGMIEFDEFIVLAAKFMVEEDTAVMEHELREAFRLYDKEGNGYITTETLREILRELDEKLTEDQLDEMIDEIDADGSGTIDYDEFMEMMRGE